MAGGGTVAPATTLACAIMLADTAGAAEGGLVTMPLGICKPEGTWIAAPLGSIRLTVGIARGGPACAGPINEVDCPAPTNEPVAGGGAAGGVLAAPGEENIELARRNSSVCRISSGLSVCRSSLQLCAPSGHVSVPSLTSPVRSLPATSCSVNGPAACWLTTR